MIRKLALLFVFLATLSMVYAFPYHLNKRAAQFQQCDGSIPGIDVKIIPDPPKAGSNLEVKGSTETNIDTGDFIFFGIADLTGSQPVLIFSGTPVDICAKTKCPTTTYNFDENYDLSNVTSFPEKFGVAVLIGPDSSDPPKACEFAVFP
ncbi:17272_t:CDS:1 [Cetraspora pellucida]|uniref:17272_t:CDS:1 n=1 Tax=Cetraspora pellucida TaxID=1433469 RepID=A0ACA9N1M0_9GLOM|nr:17272_t:CDS:1 [Cetraspora pellucida]